MSSLVLLYLLIRQIMTSGSKEAFTGSFVFYSFLLFEWCRSFRLQLAHGMNISPGQITVLGVRTSTSSCVTAQTIE